jgi:hypothetical protein
MRVNAKADIQIPKCRARNDSRGVRVARPSVEVSEAKSRKRGKSARQREKSASLPGHVSL